MTKKEREELMLKKLAEMKKFENELHGQGVGYIGGVDEVGRGPLAGPVVAACVVLPADFDVPGLDDSKKLTEKRRNEMMKVIHDNAIAYGLGKADEKAIDRVNILEATKEAMRIAIVQADKMLHEKTGGHLGHILFDAMEIKDIEIPQTSLVKGDGRSVSIAAASILAKVTRDAMMVRYSEEYPGYSFEKNKGYGTRQHYEGIREHGICPIHRRSFLKKITGE
jgi:ribonuclease HII